MTILGDRAQTMDDREQDVLTFLPGIFGKQVKENCDEQKLSKYDGDCSICRSNYRNSGSGVV
mgnify:CR=1 FL=1